MPIYVSILLLVKTLAGIFALLSPVTAAYRPERSSGRSSRS